MIQKLSKLQQKSIQIGAANYIIAGNNFIRDIVEKTDRIITDVVIDITADVMNNIYMV